uniref:putative lipid II flippase FtsW n=1 Tax=Cumulibacter manganitolerans TaxID=1884992 RepID=UPI0012956174
MATQHPARAPRRSIPLGSLRGSGSSAQRHAHRHLTALRSYLGKPMTSFYLVMSLTFALVAFGLVMMLSASAVDSLQTHGSPYYLFNKQLIFVVGGVLAMIAAMRLPLARWRALSGTLMIVTLALLVLVLVPGVGKEIYGARRWFDIGGIVSLQPSEVGKVAFLLWGAHVLVQRRKVLNTWDGMLKPIVPGLVVLCGLVIIEPDLHTTITYLIIFLGLLWVVGAPFRLFGLMIAGVLAVGVVAIASQGFRMARLLAFLDPWADAQNSGHQAIQGFYALATGGFFGVGLGNSRTKWGALPNAHSDYIFAIIGEELGFVGCALVLLLFALLAYTGFRVARRTKDLFIRLVAGATAVWMAGQALINIGYVVGLLPVTGITLPLISSGGTSIVVTMFAMGILASCARHEPAAVRHLQSRSRRFGRWLSLPVPASPVLQTDEVVPQRRSGTRKAPARRATSERP